MDNEKIKEMKDQLVEECNEHEKALQELQSSEPPLAEFAKKQSMFAADVQRFEVLISKLTSHKEKQKTKLADANIEYQTRQEEKENLDSELLRLKVCLLLNSNSSCSFSTLSSYPQ